MSRRRSSQRGSNLVEFSLVAFLVMLTAFASIEFDRMILVYTSLSNATRAGARYAIVHGSDRTATGEPASGPSDQSNVVAVVKKFAGIGALDTNTLNVVVSYPTNNKPGSTVKITTTYPYVPFVVLPIRVTLTTTAQGIIVF